MGWADGLGRQATRVGARQKGELRMSGVRVLAGTRKGAFVLTSDGKRKQWEIRGPHFAGWELYHVAEDLSECHDLASEHADRLDTLVARWWQEAERYQVLPLTNQSGRGGDRRYQRDCSPHTHSPCESTCFSRQHLTLETA